MKYLYLIQIEGTDIYKIGFTKSNPKDRVKALQTGNPFKLVLISSYKTKRATKIESALHKRYESNKVSEYEVKLLGEWFKLDITTVQKFEETCKKVDDNFKILEENSTLYN